MLLLANNPTLRALRARADMETAWTARERATCAFRAPHISADVLAAVERYGNAETAWRKCLRHRADRRRKAAQRQTLRGVIETLADSALRGRG